MNKRQRMALAAARMVFVIAGMAALAAAFMVLFMAVGAKLERAQGQASDDQFPTDLTALMTDEGFRGNHVQRHTRLRDDRLRYKAADHQGRGRTAVAAPAERRDPVHRRRMAALGRCLRARAGGPQQRCLCFGVQGPAGIQTGPGCPRTGRPRSCRCRFSRIQMVSRGTAPR